MTPRPTLTDPRRAGLLAAFLIAGLAPAAAAQFLVGPLPGPPLLTQEDVTQMNAAATRLLNDRPAGAVETWRGAESHNAGAVTLLRHFSYQGAPCLALRYRIRYAGALSTPVIYVHHLCRIGDGGWKIVETPRRGR
jgi:surface antigen